MGYPNGCPLEISFYLKAEEGGQYFVSIPRELYDYVLSHMSYPCEFFREMMECQLASSFRVERGILRVLLRLLRGIWSDDGCHCHNKLTVTVS